MYKMISYQLQLRLPILHCMEWASLLPFPMSNFYTLFFLLATTRHVHEHNRVLWTITECCHLIKLQIVLIKWSDNIIFYFIRQIKGFKNDWVVNYATYRLIFAFFNFAYCIYALLTHTYLCTNSEILMQP